MAEGRSRERWALTGSSQLSSKKLQFCKQRSASTIGPCKEGARAPHWQPCAGHHPTDSPLHLQVQGEIYLCQHQQQREKRLCRGMGMERQCHHLAATASQGHGRGQDYICSVTHESWEQGFENIPETTHPGCCCRLIPGSCCQHRGSLVPFWYL